MKKLYIFLVLTGLFLSISCEQNEHREIEDQITFKSNLLNEFYFNDSWYSKNSSHYLHPLRNIENKLYGYDSIFCNRTKNNTTYFFDSFEITDIYTNNEQIFLTKINERESILTNTECYVIKAKFLIRAFDNTIDYAVYNQPKKIDWYWVYAKDLKDNTYKLYDELPSFNCKFYPTKSLEKYFNRFNNGKKILIEILDSVAPL